VAPVSKPLEFSPGVAELTPADRRAAFLAASKKPAEEPKEEPEEKKAQAEPDKKEDEEAPVPADKGGKGEDSDEDLVSGLAKHAEKHPELKGLLTRTQKVMRQNSERKAELETLKGENESLKTRPVTVLKPEPEAPLSHLITPEAVEASVTSMVKEANDALKWLVKHEDQGGVWDEGGPNEQTLTPKQVAAAVAYYESIRDGGARKQGDDRKAYLDEYSTTVKALEDVKAEELEDPKSPEGAFLKRVPEMRRDPKFMRMLADAKAGRELREEKAKGITRVKVEPTKAKAETPKKTSDTPQGPPALPDVATLRDEAAKGSVEARQSLRSAFVVRRD
jgi:hypothetical protein